MLIQPTKEKGTLIRNHRQLTREQIYQIYALVKAGLFKSQSPESLVSIGIFLMRFFRKVWEGFLGQKCVRRKLTFLATILSFVIQNLIQGIHYTPLYFKNYSQLNMDSSNHKFDMCR